MTKESDAVKLTPAAIAYIVKNSQIVKRLQHNGLQVALVRAA